MLLWHDSLAYRSLNYAAEQYPTITGSPALRQPHADAGRFSMGGPFNFRLPIVSPAQGKCIVGFRMETLQTSPISGDILTIRTSNDTLGQVTVAIHTDDDDQAILTARQAVTGDILMRTPGIPFGTWVFVEVLVTISVSGGRVVARFNGVEVARCENANTDPQASGTWDSVSLGSPAPLIRLTDLYLCDGRLDEGGLYATFLGPVTTTKLRAAEPIERGWINTFGQVTKTRLAVFAGQSNMEGQTTSTSSARWRSPNTVIEIYDRQHSYPTVPGTFRPLQAGTNSAGQLLNPPRSALSGPEMRFAELAARFYETVDIVPDPVPAVKIIKSCRDASWVIPTSPNVCWNPGVTGNLYNGSSALPRGNLLQDVIDAVALSGGWGNIERLDFFWYQGESESLFDLTSAAYLIYLDQLLNAVRSDFAGNTELRIYIVQLHNDHERGPGPELGGLWFVDRIRQMQKHYCDTHDDCELVNVDRVEMTVWGLHLSEEGYDGLGEILYSRWLNNQEFTEPISDYQDSDFQDQYYIASNPIYLPNARALFLPESRRQLTNAPVLSVAAQLHALQKSSPWDSVVPQCAGVALPAVQVDSVSWKNFRSTAPGVSNPEDIGGSLGLGF